jgi:hypothetical protein
MEGEINTYSDERYFSPLDSKVLTKNGLSSETLNRVESTSKDSVITILIKLPTILVSNPIIKDGLKKYVLYTISAPSLLTTPIYRRYSEFNTLRAKLVEHWPGVYIPNIPHKKFTVYIK